MYRQLTDADLIKAAKANDRELSLEINDCRLGRGWLVKNLCDTRDKIEDEFARRSLPLPYNYA